MTGGDFILIDGPHQSESGMLMGDDGWYTASCVCGWRLAPLPDTETVCDALMQHAYESGKAEA